MNRAKVIETYLDLSRKAQEYEYYWEVGTGTEDDFVEAADAADAYFCENGITRSELTDHNDRKRTGRDKVIKAANIDEAKAALNNFFS